MAAETKQHNPQKHIRNAGEIHSTNIVKENYHEQLHNQQQQKNVHVQLAVKTLGNWSATDPFFQWYRISTPDMLGEPRATDMAILSAVQFQPKTLH